MKPPVSSRQRELEFRRTGPKDPTARPSSNGDSAQPGKKKPKSPSRRKYLRQYVRWLWPYRWTLLGVFLLALITAALDLVWPLAIKQIMDGVLLNTRLTAFDQLKRLNLYAG